MDDLFGAPFIKKIYNEFVRIAQLERRRGSLENGRKHDVKDHAWDAHKQGLKNFFKCIIIMLATQNQNFV